MNMDKIKELVKTYVGLKEILIVLVVLLVILVICLVSRNKKKKMYKNLLADYQVRYNTIKSVPLTFKLNKVVSMSKIDKTMENTVHDFNMDFEAIQNNFKLITQLLTQMEDDIATGKMKDLKNVSVDIDGLLATGEKAVNKLDAGLDIALQPETKQRDMINSCKERFREIKNDYNEKLNSLSFADESIRAQIGSLERKFSQFEEEMYANEFEMAKQTNAEIDTSLTNLETLFQQLPDMLTQARGILPKQIDAVSEVYSRVKSKGVYLQHLDVAKNIEMVTDSLKQDLGALRNANTNKVNEHFEDYATRLKQLEGQILKEEADHDEVEQLSELAFNKLESTKKSAAEIKAAYDKVAERYGFEEIASQLPELDSKYNELAVVKTNLVDLIESNIVPASTILLSLKDFNQSVETQADTLKSMKEQLDTVRTDEERATKQLLKLHLIMNEIQVKIRCYHLPAVSDQYEGDVKEAYQRIHALENILNEKVLNTTLLGSTLSDTIDYVYKLYNNVNNIVGMAQMVENTIVFANKYRSTDLDLDSELTRSELLFKNGEYTQALTIAINAVEKLNLDSYETLIKENAASAE